MLRYDKLYLESSLGAMCLNCMHLVPTAHVVPAGTYSNLVKQAKSKQKILDKMEAAGLTPPVQHESTFHFQFPDCDKLPPPVLPFQDVSFAYSGQDKDCLYRVSSVQLAYLQCQLCWTSRRCSSTLVNQSCSAFSPVQHVLFTTGPIPMLS